ncbi:entry of tail-anchored s factor 1-like [Octopus vulgaris]|uniref:Entry of tail-anchored s factor 1-like n=2 Tax=Octopus TaxID=6643 RepID=A0AA36FDC7_OCTVU|nr:guided entry of tail-anchored proteins factor 1 [Octopus sinensis]CAI9734045.1 entry of tail-anchored s factor 1-like [Octopus vulgaris]
MFLATFVLCIIFFMTYLPKYGSVISRWLCCVLFKADENELNLRSELRDLKTEQTTVSMSEEFARFFKLQRRIDKLGQDIKQKGNARKQKISAITVAVQFGGKVLQVLTMLLLFYVLYDQPLLQFSSAWFFPFQKVVAFPTGTGGSLGIGFWIYVCTAIINRFDRYMGLMQ